MRRAPHERECLSYRPGSEHTWQRCDIRRMFVAVTPRPCRLRRGSRDWGRTSSRGPSSLPSCPAGGAKPIAWAAASGTMAAGCPSAVLGGGGRSDEAPCPDCGNHRQEDGQRRQHELFDRLHLLGTELHPARARRPSSKKMTRPEMAAAVIYWFSSHLLCPFCLCVALFAQSYGV